MQRITSALTALAAIIFITVSAAMNSLFLSGLGRTVLEASLFGAISIASDLAKAILPVIMLRAYAAGASLRAVIAALFFSATVVLSVCSGIGFASQTRGAVTAARDGLAGELARAEADLADVNKQLAALGAPRAAAVIEASLAALKVDRRWQLSEECTAPATPASRALCADVAKHRTELVATKEATALSEKRQALRAAVDRLRGNGAANGGDTQTEALAQLAGLTPVQARLALTILLAVVLELGSAVLPVLLSAPHRRKDVAAEPGIPKATKDIKPASVPAIADREHWQKQRIKAKVTAREGNA